MGHHLDGKRILVTGACGTVGQALVDQLLGRSVCMPEEVISIDNDETALFFLEQKYLKNANANFFVSDIRDASDLRQRTVGVDIIFHCAALKHVVMCERSPSQATATNIIGVQNIIEAANTNHVEKVIFSSSDKAVNPTNVMGTTKLMGERLITAANSTGYAGSTIFSSTRFGNVLGSNGSVVEIFRNQILLGKKITITDIRMTRFVMSASKAAGLLISSSCMAKGGEVFVTKMPIVSVESLAIAMVKIIKGDNDCEPDIEVIGMKPGEKLYEELISDEEVRRTIELEDYYAVLPAFSGLYKEIDYTYDGYVSSSVDSAYVSSLESSLSVDETTKLLLIENILQDEKNMITDRYWPGDK